MSLTRDLTDDEFERLSLTRKKKYVAELLIKHSGAQPVAEGDAPIALVMAGLPGAGKTEFLDSFSEELDRAFQESFVRIDLDEIVTIYPGYTPKTDQQFRSQGNITVSKCVDVVKERRYNMMIDGTFGGSSEVSLNNIERLLAAGYIIRMFLVHDDIETSWKFTQDRELLTDRGITRASFEEACVKVPQNVLKALEKFEKEQMFSMAVFIQKTPLRNKNYTLVRDRMQIDELLRRGYNITTQKDSA
jgi:hypothetical protein